MAPHPHAAAMGDRIDRIRTSSSCPPLPAPIGGAGMPAARHEAPARSAMPFAAATCPAGPWIEHVQHIERLEPSFNERLELRDSRMPVPTRPCADRDWLRP